MPQEFKIPSSEIESRITEIQKRLRQEEVDALLIIQRVNLFYVTETGYRLIR